jgi:hypothetical protein
MLPTGVIRPGSCLGLPCHPARLAAVISAHRLPPLHDAPPSVK